MPASLNDTPLLRSAPLLRGALSLRDPPALRRPSSLRSPPTRPAPSRSSTPGDHVAVEGPPFEQLLHHAIADLVSRFDRRRACVGILRRGAPRSALARRGHR